jgi:hypothetical protein
MFEDAVQFINTPDKQAVRNMRAAGLSVAAIAAQLGTTVARVRAIVGKVDRAAHVRQQDELVRRIDKQVMPWAEAVRIWQEQTGQSEATLWRVQNRLGLRRKRA